MYQRILVAIDGSSTSHLALDHALRLAKDQGARLRIVHALESINDLVGLAGGYPIDVDEFFDSVKREEERALETSLERARSMGVKAETALIEGSDALDRVAEVVAKDAESWKADLIVLGTHGRRGFNRVLLGSFAENLVRVAALPVLLVRAK